MSKTLVVSDLHGEWGPLNKLINKKKPVNIIQLGDYGWWSHYHNKKGLLPRGKIFNQFGIKNIQNGFMTNVYWIRGNHDNADDLNCLTDSTPIEVQDGVVYCPFGSVLEVNGYTILCCGGAESIDKNRRIEGDSWWRKETIQNYEFDWLPDCHIDIVMSHTIPNSFFKYFSGMNYKINDPSTKALDLILEKYKPIKWFSGHFHEYIHKKIKTSYGECDWTSLAIPEVCQKWWIELKIK